MRLRLYRLDGDSSKNDRHRPLLIDRFPFSLCDPAEWSPFRIGTSGLHECCEITQIGDTLYVTDRSPDESTRINGRPVSVAPILPGDRMTLNSTEFLVSYERITSAPPPPTESVFPNVDWHSRALCRNDEPVLSDEEAGLSPSITSSTLAAQVFV